MSKKHPWILTGYLIIFAGLIGLAIYLQSALFLYAASALPILIVMVLPDIGQNQYISGKKDRQAVQLFKQTDVEEPLVVLTFRPGFVRWHCRKLFFSLDDIQQNPTSPFEGTQPLGVSLPVLSFDLSLNRRKSGWIGIDLAQLTQRTVNLSYTTDEITRLVIRKSDLEEVALQMKPTAKPSSANKSKSKSLSA